MRINTDPKLNFEDVLLQPKRSTLSSRKDVDMTRNFTFRNSGKQMNFLPIFASNMDGVGTFSMARGLARTQDDDCDNKVNHTRTVESGRRHRTKNAVGVGMHRNQCYV